MLILKWQSHNPVASSNINTMQIVFPEVHYCKPLLYTSVKAASLQYNSWEKNNSSDFKNLKIRRLILELFPANLTL